MKLSMSLVRKASEMFRPVSMAANINGLICEAKG